MTWQTRQLDAETPYRIYDRVYDRIKARTNKPEFSFPLEKLNQYVRGFPRGRVTTVAARTSHGKSAFILQCASTLAMNGKNVIWVSLEDDREQIVERQLCLMNQIPNMKLLDGEIRFLNPQMDKQKLENFPMYILDGYGFNLNELNEVFNECSFEDGKKADIIFFDYIQMIDDPRYEVFTNFMREVKKWCLKNNIAFVLCSQQNRQADGEPSNKGMKGSGAIEEVSDLIMLLFYPYHSSCEGESKFKEGIFQHEYNSLNDREKDIVWQHYYEISISKNKSGFVKHAIPVEFYGSSYYFKDFSSPCQIVENHNLLLNS